MESSVMTTKGQIVIPKAIRQKYNMLPGVKIVFEETSMGLVLKPVDIDFIKKSRGIVPKKKGDKPLKVWWKEYKDEEIALEERKINMLSEPQIPYKKIVKIKRTK
jgi:AbrB family looped-hinge helix DNA binding protein